MAEGLYRIGECIYMEVYPPPMPYQVCKIEELRKNPKGSVEVAAKCFYRRKDLPPNLLSVADRHALVVEEENEMESANGGSSDHKKLTELHKHLLHHRELFLSRQIETHKIDMVRGKCTVSLLNELEDMSSYLSQEDTFFYAMVYDPNQKTLLVDKGEIRTGLEYQAEIPSSVHPESRTDLVHDDTQTWEPNRMPDQKVEQFLVVARSIGTFARALLDGAKKPQISLRLGAAAASRDITLFHAMDTLHQSNYDINLATSRLVPRGPVLCADELEAWTQEEAKRFEDGLQEQKDFLYIQRKYLPWKPVKSIVAYYYMWKTTDRYQIQKRHRMIEKQNDLKEVIVHLRTPSGAPTGPRDLTGKASSAGTILTSAPENKTVPIAVDGEKGCESCLCTSAARWYPWGPAHEHCRLCNYCYTYWRKYGGLKLPSKWEATEKRVPATTAAAATIVSKKPKIIGNDHAPPAKVRGKKAPKNDRQSHGDIVPPIPFFMRPTAIALYVRHKLGTQALLKAARSPSVVLKTQGVEKPTADAAEAFLSRVKKSQRKFPRLTESTIATLRQNIALNSPLKQLIPRPSLTPISPSYKAKTTSKAKTKVAALANVSASYTAVSSVQAQTKQPKGQPVATAGMFVKAGDTKHGVRKAGRKRRREQETQQAIPAAVKLPRLLDLLEDMPPGDIYYCADIRARVARDELGRPALLRAARCLSKPIRPS
ncbi:hypothetical protein EMCRGX_G032275 [Ephydatia muelleri]|eukprot:Em0019g560a